ncbi:hypothetical protein [Tianweitania sediminis]|uniref:Uncharacterized protein n=1 Tax=Tianweitania sediminis TaxID=1502156 RepID=A0A8J7R1U3_9HYPH|nr:hypothetical protein [Tianweitania sediminis]MBP0440675.1 hypothetical protein [Tianweitania sediminis]
MALSVRIQGSGLVRFSDAVEALGEVRARKAYSRAVNDAGRDTKTPTQRALAQQTGLKVKVTRKALRITRASPATLEYKLTGTGGDIALKYFGARETRKGTSAAPFNKRKVFSGAFIKGGQFPNRVDIGRGGHVFERASMSRFPINKVKSGVVIPNEMVKDATARTFERVGQAKLQEKVLRHVKLVAKGVLS